MSNQNTTEDKTEETPEEKKWYQKIFTMQTLVKIMFFPLTVLIMFSKTLMTHLANLGKDYKDFTLTYSLTYSVLLFMCGLLIYAAVQADYFVLYYLFDGDNDAYGAQMAFIAAVSIGLGVFISSSNAVKILSHKLHKEDTFSKTSTPNKHKDHQVQLVLNLVMFIICFGSTIILSLKSENTVVVRNKNMHQQQQQKKQETTSPIYTTMNNLIADEMSGFKADSSALNAKYAAKAKIASKKYRPKLEALDKKIARWEAKPAKDWAEKQYIKTIINQMQQNERPGLVKKVDEKEQPVWEKYNDELIQLRSRFRQRKDSISSVYESKVQTAEQGIQELTQGIEDANAVTAVSTIWRNVLFNIAVAVISIMLALYFKGTRKDEDEESDQHQKKSPPVAQKTPKTTKKNISVNEGDDKNQQNGSKAGQRTPSTDKEKVIFVKKFSDFSGIVTRARQRITRSKTSATESTRKNNLIKGLSDVKFLIEHGFSVVVDGNSVSITLDNKGNVSSDIITALQENESSINTYRQSTDELDV